MKILLAHFSAPILLTMLLLAAGCIMILLQMMLPPLPIIIPNSPQWVVLVIAYGAMRLKNPLVLVPCAFLGFLCDILSSQLLGISIIGFSAVAGLIMYQQSLNPSQHWLFRIFLVLVGVFGYMMLDYLLYSAQLSRWHWPFSLWTKLVFDSLVTAVLAVILFPLADAFLDRQGVRPNPRKLRRT